MVVANVAFFSWSRGWLGSSSLGDREPDRANFSYQPDAVRVTPVISSAPCFESGPYSSSELAQAELALAGVAPVGAWVTQRQERKGLWVVYLGPFPDVDALSKKEPDLRRAKIAYEVIRDRGDLDIGFVLGRFARLEEANEALGKLADQASIRNATVVNLVQPASVHVVRVQGPSPALAQRLTTLEAGPLKPFAACQKA